MGWSLPLTSLRLARKFWYSNGRNIPGGMLVTEEFEGFKVDTLQSGTLRPDIIRSLNLHRFWLNPGPASPKSAFISLLPDSDKLILEADPVKAAESIKRFSAKDAARWPDFLNFMSKATDFLEAAYRTPMPRLGTLSRLPKPEIPERRPAPRKTGT